MARGGPRRREAGGVFKPPGVPVVGDAFRLLARGVGGSGNLVSRQPLQGKIRHLSNLSIGVAERGQQGGEHFLSAQILQTQKGVHPVRHLGRVQIVEQ